MSKNISLSYPMAQSIALATPRDVILRGPRVEDMKLSPKKLSILFTLLAALVMVSAYPANGAGAPPIFLPLIVTNMSGQPCPQWVHDLRVVKGPDGKTYPTWHGTVDEQYRCYYDHEHGDDPRKSLADSSMPAFGYIGMSMVPAMNEPHAGFKVFVQNKGIVNDDGRKLINSSSRAVVHMGTAGPGRLTERFHSLEYDFVADGGHEVRIQGMADTGILRNTCEVAAGPDEITRRIVEVPSPSCQPSSTYESWNFRFRIPGYVEVNVGTAVFDPVTTMNLDRTTLSSTADHFPQISSVFLGCDRESYQFSPYFYNEYGAKVFYTDAMGMHISSAPSAQMPLKQVVSTKVVSIARSADGQALFKYRTKTCAPGLKAPN